MLAPSPTVPLPIALSYICCSILAALSQIRLSRTAALPACTSLLRSCLGHLSSVALTAALTVWVAPTLCATSLAGPSTSASFPGRPFSNSSVQSVAPSHVVLFSVTPTLAAPSQAAFAIAPSRAAYLPESRLPLPLLPSLPLLGSLPPIAVYTAVLSRTDPSSIARPYSAFPCPAIRALLFLISLISNTQTAKRSSPTSIPRKRGFSSSLRGRELLLGVVRVGGMRSSKLSRQDGRREWQRCNGRIHRLRDR